MSKAPQVHLLSDADYDRPPYRIVGEGLQFPEGPLALPDGSVLVAEIIGGSIAQIFPGGRVERLVGTGTRANGLARGPDGRIYVCNNGAPLPAPGAFSPTALNSDDYAGGCIQVFDMQTGEISVLHDRCDEGILSSPNDIVFDDVGGFYFTCIGRRRSRSRDFGGLYYGRADGSAVREIAYPVNSPNGIGLSPDNRTLYWAETDGCRLWAQDIAEPGVLADAPRLLATLGGPQKFDSLAVQANGDICVATLASGTVAVISPNGDLVRQVWFGDHFTTNICFGGPDMTTAYVTLSHGGQLAALDWGTPGLRLNHQAR